MIRHVTTLTAVALLLGTAELSAQHQQRRQGDSAGPGGMMGQMQGMPGMAMHAFAPEHLLSKRAELGLTDDQVKQIEQLQADAKRTHEKAVASHDTYRTEMMQALHADKPDLMVIRAHFAGAHESMGEAHWAELSSGLKAMEILTDVQRAKVTDAKPTGGMQHRHGQEGQRGQRGR